MKTAVVPDSDIAWAVAGTALEPGESGDLHVVCRHSRGALLAVIDGLGHGPEAKLAAMAAGQVIEAHAEDSLLDLIRRCHRALSSTRGVVMSLASFEFGEQSLTWAGVGNVEAVLWRALGAQQRSDEALTTAGGVVGYRLPTLRARTLSVHEGDTLVMATDGLRSCYREYGISWKAVAELADSLLMRDSKGTDDALVLVARYQQAQA
jgi:serine phosphatase RsbU (regulator of sigma subunit)